MPNKASHATSEPAPGAASSAHEDCRPGTSNMKPIFERKYRILLLFIVLCAAGSLLTYLESCNGTFTAVQATRFEKLPRSYMESGRASPHPVYFRKYLYRYTVHGVEYSGKPMDSYREKPESYANTATVYFNSQKPSSFLLDVSPYISSTCGILLSCFALAALLLIIVFFLDYADHRMTKNSNQRRH